MDEKKVQIVRYLYGETDRAEEVRRLLEADEALRREHQALSEAKFWLDHRRPQRPSGATLDAVLAAAANPQADEAVRPGPRADRAPSARRRRRFGMVYGVGALLAVLVVGAGLWMQRSGDAREATRDEVLAEESFAAPLESAAPAAAPAPARAAAQNPRAVAEPAARRDPVFDELAWDDSDDVRRLQQRMEVLRTRSDDLGWDEPVVVVTPASQAARSSQGLQPAGQSRGAGW